MKRIILGPMDIVLISTIVSLLTIYGFFFVAIPQHWSLIDHYSQVLNWAKPDFDPLEEGRNYLASLISIGRFRPIDIASWMVRFRFTPISPRSFHIQQIGLLAFALAPLFLIAKRLVGFRSALIAILTAISAFTIKDWIFITTAGDPLATCFLLWALYFYIREKRWAACAFYCLSFLTKESYFSFFLIFASLDALDFLREKSIGRKSIPLVVMAIFGATFALYVRSLPQIYTANFGFGNFGAKRAITAYVLPVAKNFAPLILVLGFLSIRHGIGRWTIERLRLLVAGCAIVVVYTFFMILWGPFDSWFYMHIPIPFGWALIFASLWTNEKVRNDAVEIGIVALVSIFSMGVVLNGAKNFNDMASEAKTAAKIACEDSKRSPSLRIFTNCNEGSWQLRNYLLVDRVCNNPPKFEYLNGSEILPAGTNVPYEIVAMKQCDPVNLRSISANYELTLSWWTIRKNL